MYNKQSKKMLNICILEILREYSDENHRLKQQDIINYLKNYSIQCDRRTVKANILSLIDFGYNIECEEIVRKNNYLRNKFLYYKLLKKRRYSIKVIILRKNFEMKLRIVKKLVKQFGTNECNSQILIMSLMDEIVYGG